MSGRRYVMIKIFSSYAFFTMLPCRKDNLHKNAFILRDEQNLIHLHIVYGSYRIFSDMIPTRLKLYKDDIKATSTVLFGSFLLIFFTDYHIEFLSPPLH